MLAAARLGKLDREDELCCYSFEIDTETDVGIQVVFLVWVCDDYDKLMEFIETPNGRKYAEHFRDIPPPEGVGFTL